MNNFARAWEKIKKLLILAIIFFIRGYQLVFAPQRGVFARSPFSGCRYYPSCSEYAIRSFSHYGLWKGCGKSVWRILRCNPWSQGGVNEP